MLGQSIVSESQAMVVAESVTKVYGKRTALDNVSLSIPKGSHVLLLGPNGAGKTTLIKCIMGLAAFKGRITVDGVDVRRDPKGARRRIGYVPQAYALYDNLTVADHAKLTCKLKGVGKEEIEEKLAAVKLNEARKKKVKELSSGMRQRLGIALALLGNPPFLILDEPTSNIDLQGRYEFQKTMDGLLASGKTLLTTTHFAGPDEVAGSVVVMDHAKIMASGNPADLIGKIEATATVHLRVGAADTEKAMGIIRNEGITDITQQKEWIVAKMPPSSRVAVISALFNANVNLDDLIVERVAIESEYLKFVKGGSDC